MEESRDTIDNIKNAETAINQDPPAAEPERQQYFMERAKGQLAAGWDVPLPAASTPLGAR